MAARENQGLQIALIIFVMLTIMLSVTTFIFFRNFQFEQQKYKEEQAASTKLKGDVQTLQADRAKFVQYLGGYSANEKEATITENLDKDMKAAQALGVGNLPEEQRNYRKLVDSQQGMIRAKNSDMSKQAAELRDAKDTLAKKTKDFADERQKLETDKENGGERLSRRARSNSKTIDRRASHRRRIDGQKRRQCQGVGKRQIASPGENWRPGKGPHQNRNARNAIANPPQRGGN